MKIWVDADACPKGVKTILYRAAENRGVPVVFVANQWLQLPQSPMIEMVQVSDGADVADDEIVKLCAKGDLVITADIPLAARVVEKGVLALDPRGKLYDRSTVGQALDMRNFMDKLRGSGVETGGPKSFGSKEQQLFANELDKFISQNA
jgi:hypothetical protein